MAASGTTTFDARLVDYALTDLVLRSDPPPGDLLFGRNFLFPVKQVNGYTFFAPKLGPEESALTTAGLGLWADSAPIPLMSATWSKEPFALHRYALGTSQDIEAQDNANPPSIDTRGRLTQLARILTMKAVEYEERALLVSPLTPGTTVGTVTSKAGSEWDVSGDMKSDIDAKVQLLQKYTGQPRSKYRLALFNEAEYAALNDPLFLARRANVKGAAGASLPELADYLSIGEVQSVQTIRGVDGSGASVDMWPSETAILFYPGDPALQRDMMVGDRPWGLTFEMGPGVALPPQMLQRWAGEAFAWRERQRSLILSPLSAYAFTNVKS